MTYKRSKARADFETAIGSMLSVVRQTQRATVPPNMAEYVLSCAILNCSAKIETYIEDVFELLGQAISSAPIEVSELPQHLRAYLLGTDDQLVANYAHFVAFRDETRLLTNLRGRLDTPALAMAQPDLQSQLVDGKRIYKDCKYPSPGNLKALFHRLGLNIFAELNRRAHRDVELDLESFNSLRTSLAHSGLGPAINAVDIRRHIGRMGDLIRFVDRTLYGFACGLIGDADWQSKLC